MALKYEKNQNKKAHDDVIHVSPQTVHVKNRSKIIVELTLLIVFRSYHLPLQA